MSDNDLNVYIFKGNVRETVPGNTEKLIIDQSIRILPRRLCCGELREVTLPRLLKRILDDAFSGCKKLLKIRIGNRVRYIGKDAFANCKGLKEVEFEDTTSSYQRLTIDEGAFDCCHSLARIKLPASVTAVGERAFTQCGLIEVNLSKTRITEISFGAFADCRLLLTVSLPNTLERIRDWAFLRCPKLVTVVVPLDSKPITIGTLSFQQCTNLANLVLPNGSSAHETSFDSCGTLHDRFGTESADIVARLIARFDDRPVHRMCYHHSTTTAQELRQCLEEQEEVLESCSPLFVDEFKMTPFHILFSTAERRVELLKILLDRDPYAQMLYLKDANGKRPLYYLMHKNWADDATAEWVQLTLQKLMVESLANSGAKLWAKEMRTKVEAVLPSELDKAQRATLFRELGSAFWHFKKLESTSILEIALWKGKLKSGWKNDGSKRQALDRGECRCLCGSEIVIPNVTPFLWA